MRVVFADAYYYIAFVNERDAGHDQALEFSRGYSGRTLTTEWVLTEVADALSGPGLREVFLDLMKDIYNHPELEIVEATHQLFERGIALFSQRLDKSWSLTDCISFIPPNENSLAVSSIAGLAGIMSRDFAEYNNPHGKKIELARRESNLLVELSGCDR